MVVRDGAIVREWYGNRIVDARDLPGGHDTTHLGARSSRPSLRRITLADLVDMRSGIAFEAETRFPWVDQDAPAIYLRQRSRCDGG